MAIIPRDRSLLPACDVSLDQSILIMRETSDIDAIGGYKIPARSGRKGWETWVKTAREYTDKPLIMDGQKWGNDIPTTGQGILGDVQEAGFDAVILFPFTGPVVQYEWTRAAQSLGLPVIMGARMTHPRQIEGDYSNPRGVDYDEIFEELGFDEKLTGYIRKTAPDDMYRLAAALGIDDFVAPGNQPEAILAMKDLLEICGIEPTFYSPGLITQGGNISDAGAAAGKRFHGIAGSGIYWNKPEDRFNSPEEIRAAALELTSQL